MPWPERPKLWELDPEEIKGLEVGYIRDQGFGATYQRDVQWEYEQQSIEEGIGIRGGVFVGVRVLGASSLLEVWYQVQDESRARTAKGCRLWCGEGFQPTLHRDHGWGQPLPRGVALSWRSCAGPYQSCSLALLI